MRRNAQASIDLDALIHNLQVARSHARDSNIMAVVKAEAYGHGMVQVARVLSQAGVEGFAVACLSEARVLREAGIAQPITVFQGYQNAQQLRQMAMLKLRPVIHQDWQVDLLLKQTTPPAVWLKINTGMGRLGMSVDELEQAWTRVSEHFDSITMGLFSHFANADQPEHESNQQQLECFRALVTSLEVEETSMANSAGLLAFSESRGDWVRPGIMLYGGSPFKGKSAAELGLRPVMRLQAPIIAINQLKQGDSIGYGSLWQCPEDMPVGVVATGYGDGYPRQAGTGTPVWLNGCKTQILGRVSMDMISIDLRNVDKVNIGDPVELWGQKVPVDEVADHAQTIAYELLCHFDSSRTD